MKLFQILKFGIEIYQKKSIFMMQDNFIVFQKSIWKKRNLVLNFRPYKLPLEKSVDVDTYKDWNFMEKLFSIRSKIK
jgi:CMP-N-acetylneuraminic acid synthetase